MAFLPKTKKESEVKTLTISKLRTEYLKLSETYNKIVNGDLVRCTCCGEFIAKSNFYTDRKNENGVYPECKKCVLAEVEQRLDNRRKEPNETKQSVQKMLRKMDLPYIDKVYEKQVKICHDNVGERTRYSPFTVYMTIIKSLPQYVDYTWDNSEFADDDTGSPTYKIKEDPEVIERALKRFGVYPNEDLMFLETEYQDWISRYECNTKGQEEVFEGLSINKLLRRKAILEGKPTKELDKTYQDWLDAGNLKPKQNTLDTLSDAQTFGTLIQKYEETRPLPEIDPELQDVDKIGLYIDVFFKGHAAKMLGLKNNFTNLYEKFMKKFTVTKPKYNEEEDSETIFNKVFGSSEEM